MHNEHSAVPPQPAHTGTAHAHAMHHSMNFTEIMAMLFRNRVLFLIPTVAVFLGSIGVFFIMPKTYITTSYIQVKDSKLIDPLVKGVSDARDRRGKDEVDTLTKQIMAWPRLEFLINQLKLVKRLDSPVAVEDCILGLRKKIEVSFKNREIIEISYASSDPRKAQLIVNTLTQNFIDENSRVQREEARNAIDFIEQQLSIYRNKLDSSQQNFSASRTDTDLRAAISRRMLLRDKLLTLERSVPVHAGSDSNPVVAQLQGRMGYLETELNRLMLDAKDGSPRVVEIRREIDSLKTRINNEIEKRVARGGAGSFNPLYLQTEQEIKELDVTIGELMRRKREIEAEQKGPVKVSETQLSDLARNTKVDEDIYQMLLRQLESAYVAVRLQDSDKGSRFSVIEYARLPLRPEKPRLPRVLGAGLALGAAFGFGLVFFLETTNRSFQTADQVKSLLKLTNLGSTSKIIVAKPDEAARPLREIKEMVNRFFETKPALLKLRFVTPYTAKATVDTIVSPQVVIYHDARSTIAEEFRVIRTHIFHGTEKPPQVILMTSTMRGEGKSTTSANLSVAIADSGKRTLLVDCDLRKGVTAELFGIAPIAGMTDLLKNGSSIDVGETIYDTPVFNLKVMPSGNDIEKPSELLGTPRMKQMIDSLRDKFDVIILDCTPALNLPDTSVISKFVDGIILVVQSGRTRQADAQRTLSLLAQVNAKMIGFILTSVQYHMPQYIYDYYYNTGYETYHTGAGQK